MTETSSRLLELLSLLQARRDWPGNELAGRLEVSGRTIRRDVERLRRLGYPVESLTGPAGGYRLRAGSALPPLLLDDEEAIAIAVGLRTAAGASVAGIEEAAVRALVKLEQVLPARVRRPHIPERDFELFHGVVTAAYELHDQMLGTLLAKAGDDATVILMSDHGFHPDHLRPRAIPRNPTGPAAG